MGPKSRKRKREATPDRPRRRSRRLAFARGEQSPPAEVDISPPKSVRIDDSLMMQLVVAPPTRIAAGKSLETPLVVTFTARPRDEREDEISADTHDIWANLSLMSEDSKTCLAPSEENINLIQGNLATGINQIDEPQEDVIAYATFSGLSLLKPGRYRFRVNAVKMSKSIPEDPPDEPATTLEAIYTKVFEVVQRTETTKPDPAVEAALNRIKELGIILDQEREESEQAD